MESNTDLVLIEMAMEPISEGVIFIDTHSLNIIHVNSALERILSYRKDQLIGNSIDILFPISSQIHEFTNVLKGNEHLSKIVWQLKDGNGNMVDIDFSIQLLRLNNDSQKNIIILYIRDTTEKRNLERMLLFTQNLLHAIREIKQSIFLNQESREIIETSCISLQKARGFDLVWGLVYNEDEGEEFFLFSKDNSKLVDYSYKIKSLYKENAALLPIQEVLKDPYSLMNFYFSEKDKNFNEYYSLLNPDGIVEGLSFQISWNDRIYGALELIYFKEYPFVEDDIHILQELGNDLGFAMYSKKTEQLKTEAIQQIEYQGILLNTIDVPILSVDRSGGIQYANFAAERRLEFNFSDMKRENVMSVLGLTQTTLDYIRTRTVKREIVIQNHKVTTFPAMLHSSPIMGRNNEFLGIMIVIFDITDQKEQEIKNRNLDRLLIESAKFASIGELAAGIAHEINNPLQSALLYLEDLIQVDEEDPKERKNILQIIESANLRIKTLVKNLLDLGRNPSTEKDWISPELLLERVLDLVEANSRKKNIHLEKFIEEGLPNIYVRWQEIEQVIINCIINSINAISEMTNPPKDPTIKISIERKIVSGNHCINFKIEDNGPGIDIQMMDKLFLPLVTTRREKHGTGLGLAISKKIISSHGGSIAFNPECKIGTCIEFFIPIL